jgi:hypothetical protein
LLALNWWLRRAPEISSLHGIALKFHEPTNERLLAEIAERERIEERLRAANRTLRTINRCNEALVRATEETELARAICRILVEDGGMRMAWVGYREENPASAIRRIAHAGFDDVYLDRIDVDWADAPLTPSNLMFGRSAVADGGHLKLAQGTSGLRKSRSSLNDVRGREAAIRPRFVEGDLWNRRSPLLSDS